MDTKKIIWTIVLIVVIIGAGLLFYKQMKPFMSRPAPSGPDVGPPIPGGPPSPEAPAPAPAPAPEGAPAAPAPAPAEAPK